MLLLVIISSVYAPVSDYASQAWVSANFLSSGYVPVISGYAELSAQNVFTSANHIPYIYFNSSTATGVPQIYPSGRHLYIRTNANAAKLYFSDYYSSCTLSDIALKSEIPSTSEFATISALSSAIDSLSSVYAPLSYVSGTDDGTNWTSLTIDGTTKAIPQGGSSVDNLSEYELDLVETEDSGDPGTYLSPNINMGMNNGAYGSIVLEQVIDDERGIVEETDLTISVGAGDGEVNNIVLNANDKITLNSSSIQFAGETLDTVESWTFTLSDDTTVTKKILVG